jgi:tRNA dimethylallyltransferase
MRLIVILGPTATGKTKLAVDLAKEIGGEIISADSMQVYRGMDIGTAKPTPEERRGISHYLIDIRDPDEEWTVSDFVNEATRLSGDLANRNKVPIIVGGTGLYLWALLEGFAFPISPADKELRARLEKETLPSLYARLSAIDPEAAGKIHPNDKKRIIRALEVYELTGRPISELQRIRKEPETKRLGSFNNEKPRRSVAGFDYILIGLNLPREELYARIDRRVDSMIERGLIGEVEDLLSRGYPKTLNSFQALGYKEVIEYLDGKRNKEEMVGELKKRTRNFARRQMTWFRRFKDIAWFSPNEKGAIISLCQEPENRRSTAAGSGEKRSAAKRGY